MTALGSHEEGARGVVVGEGVHIYQQERKHLVEVSRAAILAGVEERHVVLAKEQGAMIVAVLRAVFSDAELALTPEQQDGAPLAAAHQFPVAK